MKASETYPSLYKGLAQIPIKYLKTNLLPRLEAKDKKITYTGNVFSQAHKSY